MPKTGQAPVLVKVTVIIRTAIVAVVIVPTVFRPIFAGDQLIHGFFSRIDMSRDAAGIRERPSLVVDPATRKLVSLAGTFTKIQRVGCPSGPLTGPKRTRDDGSATEAAVQIFWFPMWSKAADHGIDLRRRTPLVRSLFRGPTDKVRYWSVVKARNFDVLRCIGETPEETAMV